MGIPQSIYGYFIKLYTQNLTNIIHVNVYKFNEIDRLKYENESEGFYIFIYLVSFVMFRGSLIIT